MTILNAQSDIKEVVSDALEVLEISDTLTSKATKDYQNSTIEKHEIDQAAWETSKENLPYNANRKPREKEKKEVNKNKKSNNNNSAAWGSFFQILGIVAIITVIVLLVLYGFKKDPSLRPKNSKISNQITAFDLEKIEAHLQETNVDSFLQQAIKNQNYPLAIRLFYLDILKKMAAKELIKWKKDKTNQEYIHELEQNELLVPFKKITRIFERVWYGNTLITASDFEAIRPSFQDLLQRIQDTKNINAI